MIKYKIETWRYVPTHTKSAIDIQRFTYLIKYLKEIIIVKKYSIQIKGSYHVDMSDNISYFKLFFKNNCANI